MIYRQYFYILLQLLLEVRNATTPFSLDARVWVETIRLSLNLALIRPSWRFGVVGGFIQFRLSRSCCTTPRSLEERRLSRWSNWPAGSPWKYSPWN